VILGVAAVTLVLSLVEILDPVAFREALGLPLSGGQRGAIPVVTSLFLQPGLFGWFTAFASVILYAYFIVHRRWWMLVGALALSVGTIISGRRRPLIGIVAALFTALGWQIRHLPSRRAALRAGVPLILSVIVIVGISLPFFGEFYASTIDSYVPDSEVMEELALGDHELTRAQSRTIQPRIALYAASIAIAREHFPLGVGLGRYGSHISRVFYSPAYEEYGLSQVVGLRQRKPIAVTDTFWPMLLGETGALGLLAYGAFVGAIVGGAWRRGHAAPSPSERALHLAVLMILVLALVESTVAPTFIAPPVAYFVFVAAGASVAVRAATLGDPGRAASGPARSDSAGA
jgi:O-antigen ligase